MMTAVTVTVTVATAQAASAAAAAAAAAHGHVTSRGGVQGCHYRDRRFKFRAASLSPGPQAGDSDTITDGFQVQVQDSRLSESPIP